MPNWLVSRRPHADENKEERKTVGNVKIGSVAGIGNVKIGSVAGNGNVKIGSVAGRTKRQPERAKRQPERAKRRRDRAKIGNAETANIVDPAP